MTRSTLLGLLLVASASPAWAQRYPISPTGSVRLNAALSDIRKEREQAQQLQKAQQELAVRERQMMAAANEEVAAAKIAHRTAIKEVKQARENAAAAVEQSLGLKETIEEVARLQAAYREVSEPVLQKLKASPEFQDAEKKSAAAKEAMKRLQADQSLDEATRRSRISDLVGESLAASNLERVTLRKDEKVNAARERLEAAQQKVGELRKKASEKADSDPAVAAAQAAVKSAFEAIKAAEAKVASVRSGGAVTAQLFQTGGDQKGADGGKGNPKK
jgi:hypothetical protein